MFWNTRKAPGLDVEEQRDVLDAMLAMSRAQILAQVTDEASLDSRTVGLLAFNGALLGGTLAAKSLLGYYWWTPFIAVGISTAPCLWSVFKKTSAFGPPALEFYKEFGAEGLKARTQLLSDLDDTFDFNASRVKWKTWRVRCARRWFDRCSAIDRRHPADYHEGMRTRTNPRPGGAPVPVPPPSGLPLVGAGGVVRGGSKPA